jgi:hypothetical protein
MSYYIKAPLAPNVLLFRDTVRSSCLIILSWAKSSATLAKKLIFMRIFINFLCVLCTIFVVFVFIVFRVHLYPQSFR